MSKWRTDEPPKDTMIFADVGYIYAVPAIWSELEGEWIYEIIEINMYHGDYNDPYFSSEMAKPDELKRWMPMPELSERKPVPDSKKIAGHALLDEYNNNMTEALRRTGKVGRTVAKSMGRSES
ncbi:MAG: hypothetical protein R8K20_05895 [Gallionellaceae bacterium]